MTCTNTTAIATKGLTQQVLRAGTTAADSKETKARSTPFINKVLPIAEAVLAKSKLVTDRDIFGELPKSFQNFKKVYQPERHKMLRGFAEHEVTLEYSREHLLTFAQATATAGKPEKYYAAIKDYSSTTSGYGNHVQLVARVYWDLHETLADNFSAVLVTGDQYSRSIGHAFILIHGTKKAKIGSPINTDLFKFLKQKQVKDCVILDPYLKLAFNIHDESKFNLFKAHITSKNCPHIHYWQNSHELDTDNIKQAKQEAFRVAALFKRKILQEMNIYNFGYVKFTEEQTGKKGSTKENKETIKESKSEFKVDSVTGKNFEDDNFIMEWIKSEIAPECSKVLSSNDWIDRISQVHIDTLEQLEIIYRKIGHDKFVQLAKHSQKTHAFEQLLENNAELYGLVAIALNGIGECQVKASLAYTLARASSCKAVLFKMLNSKSPEIGHSIVLLGVDRQEVLKKLQSGVKDPIDFLKSLGKGIVFDPFLNIYGKNEDAKTWQEPLAAYNKAYGIDIMDITLTDPVELTTQDAQDVLKDAQILADTWKDEYKKLLNHDDDWSEFLQIKKAWKDAIDQKNA